MNMLLCGHRMVHQVYITHKPAGRTKYNGSLFVRYMFGAAAKMLCETLA